MTPCKLPINPFSFKFQNCTKVLELLDSSAFGPPDPGTCQDYRERCHTLFPLATAFRPSETTPTPTNNNGSSITEVKDTAPKNISASGGGVVVLKETALSSAAMSDLSGDINDESKKAPQSIKSGPAEKSSKGSFLEDVD